MRRALVVFSAAAAMVCLAASALSAEQFTKSFDYKPVDSIQTIQIAIGDVKINQIVFRVAKEATPGARRSSSEAVVRVDNEGQAPVAVAVAVVVMDESGNIVAAGSGGTRAGWLAAGGRDAAAIRFPYVYRNLAKAKRFTITVEVEPKPGSGVPAPAGTGAP